MALGYRHEFTCTNGTIPKCMNTFREDFDSRDTPSRDTIPTHGFVWVRGAIYEVADVSETLCGDYSFNGVP